MRELDFEFIGKRIRTIRLQKNLTQEYIAETVGVNVSHISNIELNKVKVSLTLLVQICNALDTSIDYILENEYCTSFSVLETELLNTFNNLSSEKKEILLKIAKVL